MEQTVIYGSLDRLEEYLRGCGITRPFWVCGEGLSPGPGGVRFSEFQPNPTFRSAEKAAIMYRESGCDCIAAIGGGSAMDVAKCVKLWAAGDAPLIAVPTTAGTGSEATHFAVIYRDGEKTSVADEGCLPQVVLFDPDLLRTLPEYHRKASMLDALCHGIESFWSVKATKESRSYAAEAIGGVLENMDAYLKNEPAGNAGMQQAAYLAGKAINITQTTAGHAMCYKLTTMYGIAHGHAAALCDMALWPYMSERSGPELGQVFLELARAFGCGSVREAAERFRALVASLGLGAPEASPGDYGILKTSVNAERLKNNPIPLREDEMDFLYHRILEG